VKITLTGVLIAVNVVVFVWQKTTYGGIEYDHGWLSPQLVLERGEWWRVVTSAFLHGNEWHVILNMIGLLWLGTASEEVFGRARFAALYAIAILGAGLGVVYFSSAYTIPTLGASGAIYGLIGALSATALRLGARGRAMLKSILPVVVLNLGLTFAFPFISAAAHIGGLIAGFLAGLVLVNGRRAFAEHYAATFVPPPRATAPVPAHPVETIEHPPDAGPRE
jgi:membrane associated rhomboid family serine protease